MGLDYLSGRKETLNGSERDAHCLNFVVRDDRDPTPWTLN
jgi:hypothetical protein